MEIDEKAKSNSFSRKNEETKIIQNVVSEEDLSPSQENEKKTEIIQHENTMECEIEENDVDTDYKKGDIYFMGTKWRLISPLGKGGCGIVFLAKREENKSTSFSGATSLQLVAVKIVAKKQYFNHELDIWKKVSYSGENSQCRENIVCLYDVIFGTKNVYYIMEYIKGEDLYNFYKRKVSVPIKNVLILLLKIFKAFQVMLELGIINRDIKEENILVEFNENKNNFDTVRVADLGVAVLAFSKTPALNNILKREILNQKTGKKEGHLGYSGTPKYSSPKMKEIFASKGIKCTYDEALEILLNEDLFLLGSMAQRIFNNLILDKKNKIYFYFYNIFSQMASINSVKKNHIQFLTLTINEINKFLSFS